jgi:hypothetical protein
MLGVGSAGVLQACSRWLTSRPELSLGPHFRRPLEVSRGLPLTSGLEVEGLQQFPRPEQAGIVNALSRS